MYTRYFKLLMLLLIPVVTLLSGFRSNTDLFEKMKGKWKVEKITYTLGTGDSTAKNPVAEFSFAGGTNPNDQYGGYYQIDNSQKLLFLYQLDSSQPTTGELIIAVLLPSNLTVSRQTYFGAQPDFSSIWTVTELPGGIFKLKGESIIKRPGGKEQSVPTEIQLKQ